MEKATPVDKKYISRYLLYLVNTSNLEGLASKLLSDPAYTALFNERELHEIEKKASIEEMELPNLLLNNDWGITPMRSACKCFTFKCISKCYT